MKYLFLILLLVVGCGKSTTTYDAKLISSSIIAGENVLSGDPVEQSTLPLHNCSSTLISEDLIVTAAHCLGSLNRGYFGIKSFRISEMNSRIQIGSEFIEVMDIRIHPKYKKSSLSEAVRSHYDIALIRLKKKIKSDYYKPVAILDPSSKLQPQTDLLLAGFGDQSYGSVEKKPDATDLQKIQEPFSSYEGNFILIEQINGTYGAFHGDSGGPAFLETDDGFILIGAAAQIHTENLVAYINLPAFKDYILESGKEMGATAATFKKLNQ